MSKIRKIGLIVSLALFALAFAGAIYADCYTFPGRRIAYMEGIHVCAYSGSSCTECIDLNNGNSCITNGESCKTGKKRPGT